MILDPRRQSRHPPGSLRRLLLHLELNHLLQVTVLAVQLFLGLFALLFDLLLLDSRLPDPFLGVLNSSVMETSGELVLFVVALAKGLLEELGAVTLFKSVHESLAGVEPPLVQLGVHGKGMG